MFNHYSKLFIASLILNTSFILSMQQTKKINWENITEIASARTLLAAGERPPKGILFTVMETKYSPELVALYCKHGADPLCTKEQAEKADMSEAEFLEREQMPTVGIPKSAEWRRVEAEKIPLEILAYINLFTFQHDINPHLQRFHDTVENIVKKFEALTVDQLDWRVLQMINHKAEQKCDVRSIIKQDCHDAFKVNFAFPTSELRISDQAKALLHRINEIHDRLTVELSKK